MFSKSWINGTTPACPLFHSKSKRFWMEVANIFLFSTIHFFLWFVLILFNLFCSYIFQNPGFDKHLARNQISKQKCFEKQTTRKNKTTYLTVMDQPFNFKIEGLLYFYYCDTKFDENNILVKQTTQKIHTF